MTAVSLHVQRECGSSTGEEGSPGLNGAIQDMSEGVLCVQEADRSLLDALRLQEQGAVRQMEHQLQERDEAIRALRQELDVRMRLLEARMDIIEEQCRHFRGREDSEGGSGQGSKEVQEVKMVKTQTSAGNALDTVFPRVDALVAKLEKRLPLRVPCAPPSAASSSSSSSAASMSSNAGSSHLQPPSAIALGATAAKAEVAGARKKPASSCRRAQTSQEERERQRVELQLRQASAKVERALAALGLA